MKQALLFGGLAMGMAASAPAQAAITIYDSPGQVQPAENVLLPSGQTGTTVTGVTNQTNTEVTFHSLNGDVLTTPANGQARIETTEPTSSLDALEFFLSQPNALGFTEFEFNLANAIGTALQTVTLSYSGTQSGTYTASLGNGSNFISGLATAGDYFTSISFDSTGAGTNDIRQIRIGGVVTSAVPEPATWAMMLIGFGLIGGFMRRKKQVVRTRVAFG